MQLRRKERRMREILFRGKRADNGQWVEGMLDGGNGRYMINCRTYSVYSNGYWVYEVVTKTVGQYTGLTDRNGKKIFEGDIVNMIFDDGADQKACAVVFHNGGFCAKLCEAYISLQKTIVYEFEWLGNIHDNPELLEGKQ